MANETFPLHTSAADGSMSVVGQLDLSELESVLASALSDPPAGFDPAHASRPDPAKPTVGPHRYTIYVPYDDGSRINVGAPHPKFGEPGITMRSKTHFHAWLGDSLQTSLSLGAAASNSCMDANKKTDGYALQTWGASNHVANFQVSITSALDGMTLAALQDIRIDSKAMTVGISAAIGVNISTPGYVAIEAGSDLKPNASYWSEIQALGLMVVAASDFTDTAAGIANSTAGTVVGAVNTAGNFLKGKASDDAKALAEYTIRKNSEAINKTLGHLRTITELVIAFKPTAKKPEKGKSKLKKGIAIVSYLLEVKAEIASICADLFDSAAEVSPIGDVNITAHKNVNVAADDSVNISGYNGVALSGFKQVSLSSLSCSMTSHKSSSIWGGLGASMKALAGDVSMASDLKGASITAKKDVEISSEAGAVTIGAELDAQLNSATGDTFIHGTKGAYIGGGEGKGMGVVMKTKFMTIGKHANVHEFKKTVNEKDCGVIKIMDKSVHTTVTQSSSQQLTDDKFELKTDTIKATATRNVEIKGKKVLLG